MSGEDYVPEHRAGDAPDDFPEEESVPMDVVFSNSVYNKLKWVSLVLLPALGVAVFAIFQLFELPYGFQVVGVITIIDTFLGAILAKSSKEYQKQTEGDLVGFIDVIETEDKIKYDLKFPSEDPNDIRHKDKVTFKVRHP